MIHHCQQIEISLLKSFPHGNWRNWNPCFCIWLSSLSRPNTHIKTLPLWWSQKPPPRRKLETKCTKSVPSDVSKCRRCLAALFVNFSISWLRLQRPLVLDLNWNSPSGRWISSMALSPNTQSRKMRQTSVTADRGRGTGQPAAEVRHNPNTCGNVSSTLSHDAHAPTDPSQHRLFAACLGGAMLPSRWWWWLLRWLLLLLLLLMMVLRARKCNAMSRQRGNEVCVTVRQKGKGHTARKF